MNHTDRLDLTVNMFCNFIKSLPEDTLQEQAWGPKEVLAHLVYHHELYVNQVKAVLSGAPFSPPQGTFRKLNAAAVAKNRGVSATELVRRLRDSNHELLGLYETHDADAISIEIKAGAKPRTLRALIPEVEAHVRNHLRKLRLAVKV